MLDIARQLVVILKMLTLSQTEDQKWKDRLDKLITYGLETFFPKDIATEISCEPGNGCKTDMFTYKGFVHRWYA